MKRRDFCVSSLAMAGVTLGGEGMPALAQSAEGFPNVPGLTKYVCGFIQDTKFEDIPENVLAIGKKSILDGFGLALAGSVSEMAPLVKEYLSQLNFAGGEASLAGTDIKVPTRFAAFANGIFIHADDFDDTQLSAAKDRVYGLLTHPTVSALASSFAMCQAENRTGKDLTLVYHIGVEVECKIAEAISPRHYNDGFHTTGTCGSFASASACARLRGLDAEKTARTLGITGSEAAGLRDNFGTMTKPFHAGRAAENGVLAAHLASLGWTAATNILEAPLGFFQAEGGGYDPHAILDRLGKPWTFAYPGVSIKPFPCGSLTHPAMGEMMDLIRKYDIKPGQVERVDVGANHSMTTTLLHHDPHTGLEAKFSMEFSMAILLLERKAGLAEFTDSVVQRPDVQQMIRRVNFYVDPGAERAGFDKMTSIVKIHMKDGRVLSGEAQFAKGSPANPMSYDEVAEKFRANAEFANWPKEKAETVITIVRSLEKEPDMSRLVTALTS